jgi:hypothetical protein
MGLMPMSRALLALSSTSAAAPSFSDEALPAVMRPSSCVVKAPGRKMDA